MSEKPILFSAPMVRAILEGKKTQTRRVLRAQPAYPDTHPPLLSQLESQLRHCPFGAAGTRLWVRETWAGADTMYQEHDLDTPGVVAYRADKSAVQFNALRGPRVIPTWDLASWNFDSLTWKPSIHMPRWASRLLLEVTSVRLERLQDISGNDCVREGIGVTRCDCEPCRMSATMCPADESAHIDAFATLWESINGKRCPWASNPWVWVVDFERVSAEAAHAP